MDYRDSNKSLIHSNRSGESTEFVNVQPTTIDTENQSGGYVPAYQQRVPGSYIPPTGSWKDGICNCFANLWPSCLCVTIGGYSGLCLTVYLAGQISTRIGWYSTKNVIIYYALAIALFWLIGIIVGASTKNTGGTVFLFYFPYVLAFVFFIVLRYKFVQFFNIDDGGGCNTCCTAFWCAPCSLCQMARHLYGYKRRLDGDSKLDGSMEYV
mmetsp:Transcript_5107/g.4599  ORF Transcript_5107/g.4599 Transcript_5107/m.4599 type:complete len:210 (-) Transcript_5107:80-709(-)